MNAPGVQAHRVASIDCGTNSIRLLVADVADVADDGRMSDVLRRLEIVRLGQDIDRTGVIAPEAMQRTLAVTRDYAEQCRELGAERVRFVATSASRDARNAADFVDAVHAAFREVGLDVAVEVVAGAVEARLSFVGATADVQSLGVAGPYLVVDIGGGSTELVRGTTDVVAERSVDVGSVRMTERHLRSDPPLRDEVEGASRDISAALDTVEEGVDLTGLGAVVGVAGTITTVTAHVLRLPAYDSNAVHLARRPAVEHFAACRELLGMSRAQRAELPYVHPGRVDVIGAGALVWSKVLARALDRSPGAEVVTSERDILDGIALSLT